MRAVKAAKISMSSGNWTKIASTTKDMVRLLLTKDPKARLPAIQVLQHEWLADENACSAAPSLSAEDMKQLKAFGRMHELKKAAVEVVVTQLPDSSISSLKDVFMNMDVNKDGTLSFSELKKGLEEAGVKLPKNFKELVAECDTDGSGVIDYTEFLAATLGKKLYHQKEIVWAAFCRFDLDGSGYIDRKELSNVLNEEVQEAMELGGSQSAVQKIFADVDANGDNKIDFD